VGTDGALGRDLCGGGSITVTGTGKGEADTAVGAERHHQIHKSNPAQHQPGISETALVNDPMSFVASSAQPGSATPHSCSFAKAVCNEVEAEVRNVTMPIFAAIVFPELQIANSASPRAAILVGRFPKGKVASQTALGHFLTIPLAVLKL